MTWKCNIRNPWEKNSEEFYIELHKVIADSHADTVKVHGPVDWLAVACPAILEMPRSVFDTCQEFIRSVFEISRRADYQSRLFSGPFSDYQKIKNDSVLMAYDFHLDETGAPRLVEINTNAAGYLISEMVYRAQKITSPDVGLQKLISSFVSEANRCGKDKIQKIAIVDENIESQKMIYEFYLYKAIFSQMGWAAEICDIAAFNPGAVDFVYNRHTDFYLDSPISAAMKKSWLDGKIVLSPNPKEYLLLADKQRLIDFSTGENKLSTNTLTKVLIRTENLKMEQKEEYWSRRKSLFFKPQKGYGGKSVYRGHGISRRKFDEICQQPMVVQEFVPAPEFDWNNASWKYDLRFFVYRDQIQSYIARVYRGQVTNFNTAGGGFGAIIWV